MLTTKIRTAIAVGAVGAALGSSGVASAASVTPHSSTTATVAAGGPTAAAPMVEYTILVGAVVEMLGSLVPG
jgi:hypothetical protein